MNGNTKALRPVNIIPGFQETADGSALISFGRTRVLCSASIQQGVPPFLRGTGQGWLTAEYAMLPCSTQTRKTRPSNRPDGRSIEIQRLIARSLRAAIDTQLLGEYTITIDCDVIQADGGTRTASITGGYVALALACEKWVREGKLPQSPIVNEVAAVSVGLVGGQAVLDMDYAHDSTAQADMNIVGVSGGGLIEVQGTGEKAPFSSEHLGELLKLAQSGIDALFEHQRKAIALGKTAAPLVVATQNPGKLRELREMLSAHFPEIISLADAGFTQQAEETEDTFAGNAIIKAEHAARLTGHAALADDSGLEVDALNKAPGVYSARYAGQDATDADNLNLLLDNLREMEGPLTARFVCCAALARPGRPTLLSRGTVEGHITLTPRGDGGFGYDPVFIAQGDKVTFAELPPEEKNKKSHRAMAIEALRAMLESEK